MKDSNFWIGTAVGSLSALFGAAIMAWLQYRLRIREHEYKRKQGELDRQKQHQDSEKAEREATIALLSDIYGDRESRDRLNRTLGRYFAGPRVNGFLGRSVVQALGYDYFPKEDLRKMRLAELRVLHAIATNIVSLAPAEEAEREGIIALLSDVHHDPQGRDRLKRALASYVERHQGSRFARVAFDWALDDHFSHDDLRRMDLPQLRFLCATVVNMSNADLVSHVLQSKDES